MRYATLPAALLLAAALPLAAQTAEIDTDGDGMYSMEELMAMFPTLTEEEFQTADADGDGMLSEEELTQARTEGVIPATEG